MRGPNTLSDHASIMALRLVYSQQHFKPRMIGAQTIGEFMKAEYGKQADDVLIGDKTRVKYRCCI
jgi:hypothetical protein